MGRKTSDDIRYDVNRALDAGPSKGIDRDAVVADIVAQGGKVDDHTFWQTVARHDSTQR